jgi:hypothetical protein
VRTIVAAARGRVSLSDPAAPDSLSGALIVAFDDPDRAVRGAAWWLIAHHWETGERSREVLSGLAESLAGRFGVERDFEGLETATCAWFDGVAFIIGRTAKKLAAMVTI